MNTRLCTPVDAKGPLADFHISIEREREKEGEKPRQERADRYNVVTLRNALARTRAHVKLVSFKSASAPQHSVPGYREAV